MLPADASLDITKIRRPGNETKKTTETFFRTSAEPKRSYFLLGFTCGTHSSNKQSGFPELTDSQQIIAGRLRKYVAQEMKNNPETFFSHLFQNRSGDNCLWDSHAARTVALNKVDFLS
jgi:hypothetical protein